MPVAGALQVSTSDAVEMLDATSPVAGPGTDPMPPAVSTLTRAADDGPVPARLVAVTKKS